MWKAVRVLVLAMPLLVAATAGAQRPARSLTPLARAQTRYLVLCLDGVPYDLVAEMHRRGQLRQFHPPVPLISGFPTFTNVGMVEILAPLGAPLARGYEDYYFDPLTNRMRGGLLDRIRKKTFVQGNFRQVFHYHPHPLAMSAEYVLPFLGPWIGGTLQLGSIKRAFLRSREPVFLAYLDSTDPTAHVSGRRMLRKLVERVDHLVTNLRRAGLPFEVVVFSDHGNAFRRLRRTSFARVLRSAGFRVRNKIKDPQSVVVPTYGLESAATLYTHPGREPAVAAAVVNAPGVEFVLYRSADAVEILSPAGRARVRRRGAVFRYEPESGDPLALRPIVDRLQAEGRADVEGFVHEDDWLRATADHIYPDPLRRLWFAFEGRVEHAASVIVSLAEDHFAGSALFSLLTVLQATHGSLRRLSTLGFAMSTAGPLLSPLSSQNDGDEAPTALRGKDFWPAVARQRDLLWQSLALPRRPCLTLLHSRSPAALLLNP